MAEPRRYKIPESVLVVIHTAALEVLLIERADHPGYWQSVTGSRACADEPLEQTCRREVAEETGIDSTRHQLQDWRLTNTFEIFSEWRQRYAPGITRNIEHVFGMPLPEVQSISPAPGEHRNWAWMPWQQAAEQCFSWTNRDAILMLPARIARAT